MADKQLFRTFLRMEVCCGTLLIGIFLDKPQAAEFIIILCAFLFCKFLQLYGIHIFSCMILLMHIMLCVITLLMVNKI